ncbi:MAG TPA: NAD(P)-binding domain-containing protein, partial [Nitrososphaeraceae archaeon]|nr:NAD(P)-binding domain-containing protein [Nitrososphaeraceae archaeon]
MKEAPRVSFDVNSCGDEHPCGEYLVFPEITFHKVLVIGLGQLGLPVAKYIKERGFDVYGYDISTKALERAEKIAGIKKAINFSG